MMRKDLVPSHQVDSATRAAGECGLELAARELSLYPAPELRWFAERFTRWGYFDPGEPQAIYLWSGLTPSWAFTVACHETRHAQQHARGWKNPDPKWSERDAEDFEREMVGSRYPGAFSTFRNLEHSTAARLYAEADARRRQGAPVAREHFTAVFHQTAADAAAGEFEGYASTFGTLIDSFCGPTRIMAGAFTQTLIEDAHRVKVLWQHDAHEPIGVPTEMREDSHGLFVKARLARTARGLDAIELLRSKVVDQLSIGFDVVPGRAETINGIREIRALRLAEFSLVTFAADKNATVSTVFSTTKTTEPGRAESRKRMAEINHKLRMLDIAAARHGIGTARH